MLGYGVEFRIYFQNDKYELSQNKVKNEIYFTTNEGRCYVFTSIPDFTRAKLFKGSNIIDVWENLVII
jgi:hypothetical protein